MDNPLALLHDKVGALPKWLQTVYYAIEASVVAALVIFLTQISVAIQSPHGLEGFDWGGQARQFFMAVEIGLVKALLDTLKAWNPPDKGATP